MTSTNGPSPVRPPSSGVRLQAVPSLDRRGLRGLLGQFATGVTVVTTRAADGRKVGLTANSFTSVSLDPPLVLWCLDKGSPSLEAFTDTSHFAIHVLAQHQDDLSQHFARPAPDSLVDKFVGIPHGEGPDGVPLLDGALATLLCASHARHEAGDHIIFIGKILEAHQSVGDPLIFHAGRYRVAWPHPAQAR